MYPELFYNVLMHELVHTDDKTIIDDFKHDMKSRTPGLFRFMRKHISAWTQLLPIYWSISKKRFIYDLNRIIDIIIIGATAYSVYWLLSLLGRFVW